MSACICKIADVPVLQILSLGIEDAVHDHRNHTNEHQDRTSTLEPLDGGRLGRFLTGPAGSGLFDSSPAGRSVMRQGSPRQQHPPVAGRQVVVSWQHLVIRKDNSPLPRLVPLAGRPTRAAMVKNCRLVVEDQAVRQCLLQSLQTGI